MIIANPIFDVVFKALIENEKIAKFFIGTLMGQTIETVEVKPQEFTYKDQAIGIAVFRLDFVATIKTENGERKKVLIEIQKAKNQIDLMRFRNYLAEQYKKEDTMGNEKIILPILTIYILGFNIPEIEASAIKVERNYIDLVNNKVIEKKSDFVEKLTHDSYVVQVNRIKKNYTTRLEKLLSLFEQQNFSDDKQITKEFTHEVDSEEMKLAVDILHYAGTNPDQRKKLEIEQEAWRTINAMFEDKETKLMSIIQEKDSLLNEKDSLLNEKNKAMEMMAQELEELKKKFDGNK